MATPQELLEVITERHQRELEALFGEPDAKALSMALAVAFTVGRIMGAAQAVDVLNQPKK